QAIEDGAPKVAADLLNRALVEPPPSAQRIVLLRRTARAEVIAGRESALVHLEEALSNEPRSRSRLPKSTQRYFAGWMRWIRSSEGWQSLARPMRRSLLDCRANSLSAVFTTRVAPPASSQYLSTSAPRLLSKRILRRWPHEVWRWSLLADRRKRRLSL